MRSSLTLVLLLVGVGLAALVFADEYVPEPQAEQYDAVGVGSDVDLNDANEEAKKKRKVVASSSSSSSSEEGKKPDDCEDEDKIARKHESFLEKAGEKLKEAAHKTGEALERIKERLVGLVKHRKGDKKEEVEKIEDVEEN